ncbi:ArsA family ATPase [Catellatospora bangladeshensis]
MSTDPAHSLGDAFGAALGAAVTEVDAGLHAAQVDPRALVDRSWRELRGHLRTVLAGAGVDELAAEELTVLPGVEELLALAEVQRLARTGPWDVVVVDCGPTAETLRLLALPEAVAGYLERLFPTHRRVVRGLLAGLAGPGSSAERWDATADALGRLAEDLGRLRELLTSPDTAVRLVLTPERVVAAETRRTVAALALLGVRVDGVVANRLVPDPGADPGPAARWLRTRRAEQEAVLASLADLGPVRTVEHLAGEPVGLAALLDVAERLYAGADPLAGGAPGGPLLEVEPVGDEYRLRLALRVGDSDLDLARVGDDLAVTVDGRRRLIALPSLLRRCAVVGAELDDTGLAVRFRPDPDLWMR